MNLKQALKRIEELEARVKQLEMQPKNEIHYHTHPPAFPWLPAPIPTYVPPVLPAYPDTAPYTPPGWPTITCASGKSGEGLSFN